MIIEDRLLFLKYALPCAGTLVKRGSITQEAVDRLISMVAGGRVPEEGAEAVFKVATAMCGHYARLMGKPSIDSEVIRRYFLVEHSVVVDERYELMKDFDPVSCKTYSAKVLRSDGSHALVQTNLGKRSCRADFARDVKAGDTVVVHWDFIVERIPESVADSMATARKNHEK